MRFAPALRDCRHFQCEPLDIFGQFSLHFQFFEVFLSINRDGDIRGHIGRREVLFPNAFDLLCTRALPKAYLVSYRFRRSCTKKAASKKLKPLTLIVYCSGVTLQR